MKKFTLLMAFASGLCLQAVSQGVTNVDPATLSRSGNVVAKASNAPMKLINPPAAAQLNSNEPLKYGGIPAIAVAFSDDCSQPNDTTSLKARGYIPYYRGSGPAGTTAAWFQGNATVFPDFNNGSDEYIGSNYNSVTLVNNIDNWLVLPALDIAAGDVLSFYSRAPSASTFPDSIRVMFSAVGDSVPEDLSWVELGRFKVNTSNAWLQDAFIAPAAGTTARFAIRYTVALGGPQGNNSDYIGIDQIDVITPAAFDLQSVSVTPLSTQYTRIPLTQVAPITLTAAIKNNGSSVSSGGTALFEIVDTVSAAVVFTESVPLPAINPGATSNLSTTNPFTPTAIQFLRSKVTVNFPGDANSANDVAQSFPTAITDSVYARDNNLTTGSLGIGAGPANGIVGQNFTVNTQGDLTSVSFFITDGFNPNPAGSAVYATIHTQTPGSTPSNTTIGTTTTVNITPGQIVAPGQWFTLPMSGSALQLNPGLYFIGIHETDSLLTLGTTNQLLTANAVWVSWATIPAPPAVNGWATASDFNFNVTYNLRANFGLSTGISDVETNSSLISVYPSPANNEVNIRLNDSFTNAKVEIYNSSSQLVKTIRNVNGLTKVDISAFANGLYSIKVSDNGKEFTQRFSVVK